MAATLLLDRTAWDLVLDAQGNIAVATEPYALAQDAASQIRLGRGELWYDRNQGIPYDQILGKSVSPEFLRAQFIAAALLVPDVLTVKVFLDAITMRQVTGQVQINGKSVASF